MPVVIAIDAGTTGVRAFAVDEHGAPARALVPRVPAALPAAGLGRARRRRHLARHARDARRGRCARSSDGRDRRRDRDHEPARDGGRVGPRARARRATARSCGRTGARPARCDDAARRGPRAARSARDDRARARPVLLGDEARVAAARRWRRGRRRPRCSAPSTPGSSGASPAAPTAACTRPTRRTRAARCSSTSARSTGPTSCARCSTCRARACRPCSRRAAASARRTPDCAAGLAVPVSGIAGDQQAALFGQACVEPGHDEEHVRHRLVRAHERRRARCPSPVDGLLTTVAWSLERRRCRTRWRARSSSPAPRCSGCATDWRSSPTRPRPARSPRRCPTAAASSVVPAFTGLGSPWWDPYARGTIVGITRGTTRAHLARAVVEAMAFQTADVVDAITAASGTAPPEVRDRRRRVGDGPAVPVPGRPARRSGAPRRGAGDHRARRRVPRRARPKACGTRRPTVNATWRADASFDARDGRRPNARAGSPTGAAPSNGPATGRRTDDQPTAADSSCARRRRTTRRARLSVGRSSAFLVAYVSTYS